MPVKRRNKGKHEGKQSGVKKVASASSLVPKDADCSSSSATNNDETATNTKTTSTSNLGLILTSDKRRGVYECDYCGTDISQTPRVRCAVCDDFDLCCDCFAATAKLKQHDPATHGYRVCDSCRYPLFPVNKKWGAAVVAASVQKKDTTDTGSNDDVAVSDNNNNNNNGDDGMEGVEETKEEDKEEIQADEGNKEVDDVDRQSASSSVIVQASDDPKTIWTVEEDLRLLQGIQTHGLGNWPDIAEAVAGQGSAGKTAKRCMERYFDDFLGRYGHILPPLTLISETTTTNGASEFEDNDNEIKAVTNATTDGKPEEAEATRSSKRRSALLRSPSSVSNNITGDGSRKKYKAVPTESIPEYQKLWPEPYLPTLDSGPVEYGQEVGRDQSYKAELTFVRTIASMDNKEQIERVRKDWEKNRLMKPGGPTVLPMRPDDVPKLRGSELLGFMPRRGDFDVEWENDAEHAVADMEFIAGESEQDRNLKLQVLAIYNSKLDEREKRKQFVLSRKLYDYRKRQEELQKLPRDERDLVHRMRLFERFHTPAEHQKFIADLLKAKRLRKEIAKLQMYRRMGIKTLAEAERYELDKSRRQFHKMAQAQKEAETKKAEAAMTGVDAKAGGGAGGGGVEEDESSVYWKQYRTTDRKVRRSINRGVPNIDGGAADKPAAKEAKTTETADETKTTGPAEAANADIEDGKPKADDSLAEANAGKLEEPVVAKPTASDAMDVDAPGGNEKFENKDAATNMDVDGKATSSDEEKDRGGGDDDNDDDDDGMSKLPGYKLLSAREVDLCRSVSLLPAQYLEIKKALIHEALTHGILDDKNKSKGGGGSKKSLGSGVRRTLVKIDVERRGAVIDFVVRAGWISAGVGETVRSGM